MRTIGPWWPGLGWAGPMVWSLSPLVFASCSPIGALEFIVLDRGDMAFVGVHSQGYLSVGYTKYQWIH